MAKKEKMSITEVKLRPYCNQGDDLFKCLTGRETKLRETRLNYFLVQEDGELAVANYNPMLSTSVTPYPVTENLVCNLVSFVF